MVPQFLSLFGLYMFCYLLYYHQHSVKTKTTHRSCGDLAKWCPELSKVFLIFVVQNFWCSISYSMVYWINWATWSTEMCWFLMCHVVEIDRNKNCWSVLTWLCCGLWSVGCLGKSCGCCYQSCCVQLLWLCTMSMDLIRGYVFCSCVLWCGVAQLLIKHCQSYLSLYHAFRLEFPTSLINWICLSLIF